MAKRRKDSFYRKVADEAGGFTWEKSCPNCTAELGRPIYYPLEFFGERNMRVYGVRIQSWCSACRTKRVAGKRQHNVERHEQAFITRARQAVMIARQLRLQRSYGHEEMVEANHHSNGEPELITDGLCVRETILALLRGERSEPAPKELVDSFRRQAEVFVSTAVGYYEDMVALGEVGKNASAQASDAPPRYGTCPIGVLHGRVQSGKTIASILTTALAIDNAFRVIIVIVAAHARTVRQTVRRFRALEGPLVFCPPDDVAGSHSWLGSEQNIRRRMGSRGIVFVSSNDEVSLRKLISLLQESGADKYPALIIEDGADLDAPIETTPPILTGRPETNLLGTTHLVFKNGIPGEEGHSLRETLRHNVLVRIAADPMALVKSEDRRFGPSFVQSFEPGPGYVGGDAILLQGERFLIHVPDDEPIRLADEEITPIGLACSIAFFLLAALARNRYSSDIRPTRRNVFLCHADGKRAELNRLIALIMGYVDELSDHLETIPGDVAARREIEWAYGELTQTVSGLPCLDSMLKDLARLLPSRVILGLHVPGDELDTGRALTLVVGGNRLVRGLSIENLLVTYPLDLPRMSRGDALLQHAIMFGYRRESLPFSRFFLTRAQAERFRAIYETETNLIDLGRHGD